MTRVTIEDQYIKVTIESQKDDMTLDELIPLLDQAIRGVGYIPPNTELGYDVVDAEGQGE